MVSHRRKSQKKIAIITKGGEESEQNNNSSTKKKKRKVGLASTDAETVKRVMTLARKARPAALKKMKEERGGLPLKMGLATLDKATR